MAKPSKQEWIEYLAEVLLKTGQIVSDEKPYKMTSDDVKDFIDNVIADQIPVEPWIDCWKDDEGEADVKAMEEMLNFGMDAAKEFIDVTLQDHQSDYASWGKAE